MANMEAHASVQLSGITAACLDEQAGKARLDVSPDKGGIQVSANGNLQLYGLPIRALLQCEVPAALILLQQAFFVLRAHSQELACHTCMAAPSPVPHLNVQQWYAEQTQVGFPSRAALAMPM